MSFKYYEYKYLVPAKIMHQAKSILEALYGNIDPYPKSWVTSVYFDSEDNKCLKECSMGAKNKRKFRVRAYDQTYGKNLQLQIKEKELSAVTKHKLNLNSNNIFAWPSNDKINSDKITSISSQYVNLRPYILVEYFRHRYRVFDYRVTLDENIRIARCEGLRQYMFSDFLVPFNVLEIKTLSERPYLPFLKLIKLNQMSFSKFYTGIRYLEGNTDIINKYL